MGGTRIAWGDRDYDYDNDNDKDNDKDADSSLDRRRASTDGSSAPSARSSAERRNLS